MQLVLYEPEIPPNTGTIARLCAATKTPLHLIRPLGFSLEDRYLKRAGLDYWPHVNLSVWNGWEEFKAEAGGSGRLVYTSARQGTPYHRFSFIHEDIVVLGPETRGLPEALTSATSYLLRIPIWGKVRSLNLANAASILLYEGLRQCGELDRQLSGEE